MDREENNSDIENWVIVDSCDIAEEAISPNHTTDSDHESESSISIISGVTTPNECHSEEETIPNIEPQDEKDISENLSISTRSSVEKIEISDEDEETDALLPPSIKVIHIPQSSPLTEEEKDPENEIDKSELNLTPLTSAEVEEISNFTNFESSRSISVNDESDFDATSVIQSEEIGMTEEKTLDPMICPRIIIQSIEKIADLENETSLTDSLPKEPHDVGREHEELSSEKQFQEPVMEVEEFFNECRTIQYNLPPDDNDSWPDDSSSDYNINQGTQIVPRNVSASSRQDGLIAALSQNSLLIGAMFFLATALLKLYLLKDNIDISNQSASNYELDKLREKYQTVDMQYTQGNENMETVVQFCTTKHSSNNHKVEKCIHKRMKKINNERNTKKKKMTLDMREKLLAIREKDLEKKEQELLEKLEEFKKSSENNQNLPNNLKRFPENIYIKKTKNHLKKKVPKNTDFINKQNDNNDDFSTITEESDPIEELNKRISDTEISTKTVVTFKEIALALREKELVGKLQHYNDNLENRINDIININKHTQKEFSKKEKIYKKFNHKTKKFDSDEVRITSEEKDISRKKHKFDVNTKNKGHKKIKYNSKGSEESFLNSKEKKDNSEEKKKVYTNKIKSDNDFKNLNHRDFDEFESTEEYKSKEPNLMRNFKKFRNYKTQDPKDELYIKYNPLKNVIDIVNISKSEDKYFILLKNSNKTVNGQWYINLHHARSMLRSKERSADWYFDRVLHRDLKRNKAKWYFDYMNGRQNTRECFI